MNLVPMIRQPEMEEFLLRSNKYAAFRLYASAIAQNFCTLGRSSSPPRQCAWACRVGRYTVSLPYRPSAIKLSMSFLISLELKGSVVLRRSFWAWQFHWIPIWSLNDSLPDVFTFWTMSWPDGTKRATDSCRRFAIGNVHYKIATQEKKIPLSVAPTAT
jgi:hypothetical protein